MAHARARKGKSSPPPKPPARTPPKTPRPRPRARLAPLAAVLLALVGLAVSAALLVDSLQPVPAFCAAGGCEAVRATSWARPLGIPMPVIGLAFFAAALVLAALPRLAAVRTLVALIGAAGGIGLLALQAFVIGEWCRLCVIADLAAIDFSDRMARRLYALRMPALHPALVLMLLTSSLFASIILAAMAVIVTRTLCRSRRQTVYGRY